MDDKPKTALTGMSYAVHDGERMSVRALLRRKMMQKELARRRNRGAEAITLVRRAS